MASKTGAVRKLLGPIKYRLEQKLKAAHDLLAKPLPTDDADALELAIDDLTAASDNLSTLYERYHAKNQEWHDKISSITDASEQQEELDRYDHACKEYTDTCIEADDVLNKLNRFLQRAQMKLDRALAPQSDSTPASATSAAHNQLVSQTSPRRSVTVKMPKINLTRFSGNYLEWEQFWGIFEANIHSRDDLTNIEKFTYLIGQLDGTAKSALKGMKITDSNYTEAVALLLRRFHRADKRIITMLYTDLRRLSPSDRKLSSKQKVFDECERIFRQLSSAGENLDANHLLSVDLLSKFPDDTVRELQLRYDVDSDSPLAEVREALENLLMREEVSSGLLDDLQRLKTMSTPERQGQQARGGQEFTRSDRTLHGNTSALPAVVEKQFNRTPPRQMQGNQLLSPPSKCYFCDGSHFNSDCTVYATARERIERLKQLGRCQRCMKRHAIAQRGHSYCPGTIKCIHCRNFGDHVSSLCFQQFPQQKPQNPHETTPKTVGGTTAAGGSVNLALQHPATPSASVNPQATPSASSVPGMAADNQLKDLNTGGITALNSNGSRRALFQTAKAVIVNPVTGQQQVARLAMDTLSSKSYILERKAQQLDLQSSGSEKLFVSVFGTNNTLEIPTHRVKFAVACRDGMFVEVTANTTRTICKSPALPDGWTNDEQQILHQYRSHLADDPFDSYGGIDVLIGADLVWQFISGPSMVAQATKLIFIPSRLGLLLGGESQYENESQDHRQPTMLCITESTCTFPSELGLVSCETSKLAPAYPDVNEFWKLESIGITDDPIQNDDEKAVEKFEESIKYKNGRYEVGWPWIESKKASLPDNYDVAYDRFRTLARRLNKEPQLLQGYRDILKVQLERNIIEEVPQEELQSTKGVHYLPHHAVLNSSSMTTKVRIVFDASSKSSRSAASLNECMYRGPTMLPDLCHILMRFRTKEVVVVSDIEKAFFQVSLISEDRDVTRFLWFKDDTVLKLTNNIKAYRFTRVNFGVISSPFLLAATINHHFSQEGTQFADALREDIYVDNVISGLNSDECPFEYYENLKDLFQRAGMNIREFCSNSKEFMDRVPDSDKVKVTDVKVLGLKWDSLKDDTIRLIPCEKIVGNQENVTKRSILQATASIFDPLGLFQPATLPAKLLLQRLWSLASDWDTSVDEGLKREWNQLKQSLCVLFTYRIPRFIGPVTLECTLAVFSDASKLAYATAVYLRWPTSDGGWKANLIFAKSKLSPTFKRKGTKGTMDVALPRLELLGLTIAARAAKFCREGLKMPSAKVDFFVDSQCVLHWVRNSSSLKCFVANRVREIREVSNCEYHFVPTDSNPADFGTRGMTASDLCASQMWWKGPEWLTLDQDRWPKRNMSSMTDSEIDALQAEVKGLTITATLGAVVTATRVTSPDFAQYDPSKTSSLQKLLRVSSIVLKYLKRRVWHRLAQARQDSLPRLKGLFDGVSDDPAISSTDYTTAKRQWIKCVQQHYFEKQLEELHGLDQHRNSMIQQLGLRLDDHGIIRTIGRLANSDLPASSAAPILLPKQSRFSQLVVLDVHNRISHCGVSHTLCQVRQEYWIVHGRQTVRNLLRKCVICRRHKTARPFKLPPMPSLPSERVRQFRPFENVGLDYFGPITVKVGSSDEKLKMWVCLYTCLSIRAVHLEPVMDCSAHEFLACFIRFVSRRGVPTKIISDNAAQFRLVNILGSQAWKRTPTDDDVLSYSASNGVTWRFITELAPWQGGFYERLVGVVKSALRGSIRRKMLTWTDLVTLLTETEAIVNSRPITYVGDDPDSQFRVLRPSDFLLWNRTSLTSSECGAEVTSKDFGEAGKRLVSLWKQRCRSLQKLWKVWYEEYVLSLREKPVVSHPSGRSDARDTPYVDQVVIVYDPDAPRGQWKLARVTEVIVSNDSHVRSAEVELPSKIRIKRPINHLIPLEVPIQSTTDPPDTTEGDISAETQSPVSQDVANDENSPQPPNQTDSPNSDEFLGFEPEDVDRAVQTLRLLQDAEDRLA